MRPARHPIFAALVLLACVASAQATEEPVIDAQDQQVMSTDAFLSAHPDMKYRIEGWNAYTEGDFELARTLFLKAAAYGDKPSQGLLAEMAWKGQGQPVDRPTAYAWADLSAERGYRDFVALREQYWRQLSKEERVRAIAVGQPLLATYADAVTGRKLTRFLRRQRFGMISYRPRKDVTVLVPGRGGLYTQIRGHDFYASKFWEPAKYREWVDAVWTDPPRENVDVGEPSAIEPGE
jgi:hypothetical protein